MHQLTRRSAVLEYTHTRTHTCTRVHSYRWDFSLVIYCAFVGQGWQRTCILLQRTQQAINKVCLSLCLAACLSVCLRACLPECRCNEWLQSVVTLRLLMPLSPFICPHSRPTAGGSLVAYLKMQTSPKSDVFEVVLGLFNHPTFVWLCMIFSYVLRKLSSKRKSKWPVYLFHQLNFQLGKSENSLTAPNSNSGERPPTLSTLSRGMLICMNVQWVFNLRGTFLFVYVTTKGQSM